MLQATLKNRTIFCKDNLDILQNIDSQTIDLIYLDPPFNKKRTFHAPIGSESEGASFKDTWYDEDLKLGYIGLMADKYPKLYEYVRGIENIESRSHRNYLIYMAQRLIEMQRILKDTGSLYLHCDPTMSHYLKLLMDIVFGHTNFRNEIVWGYAGRGMSKKWFNRKHDIIFLYGKTKKTKFCVSKASRPINPSYTSRYNKVDDKGRKFARIRNRDGSYSNIYLKKEGVVREDWWTDIPYVRGEEYIGYPTQKPLALLERLIKASTNKDDIVLDPFCGCASTCIAAEQLNRQWVGIDVSKKAYDLVKMRLAKEIEGKSANGESDFFKVQNSVVYREDIPQRTDLNNIDLSYKRNKVDVKHLLYDQQEGRCKGCNTKFDYRHFSIDHIVAQAKGGGHNIENLQLLCHHCNSLKGDRDMVYLEIRLKKMGIK